MRYSEQIPCSAKWFTAMSFGGHCDCVQTWNDEYSNFTPWVINAVSRDAHLANAAHAI
jgi:hypothetical protein